ncbi:tau-tubulin kinase 2 [Anaeramoeba flamelloides]|uniref:non-specific serine/threonine protein kinase n=1 Tax=Anaeramoeba flamelloides TaxID=1746091 RepID=A0ABQ8YWX2_9EUKA|nr:tau-tubulin kinase 2 [Anaeramoeba flamelloides]
MLSGSIRGRWYLVTRIGQGGFGEIYIAHDHQTDRSVAIKFEKRRIEKVTLKFEIEVLNQLQSSSFFPNFICSGCSKDFNYLVMDLHGPNLSSVRRHHRKRCFSITTTIKIGIEMISAIKEIHKIGYIHRDIKPSNFVLHHDTTIKKLISKKKKKNDKSPTICLLDFGLARKYLDNEGNLLQSRGNVGFRGTARYASLNSHLGTDLSRRDDIWSLLYLLIECIKGELPWSRVKDRQLIFELKKKFNSLSLVKGLPRQFTKFYEYVKKLKFQDSIDYSYLIMLLKKIIKEGDYEKDSYTDWGKSFIRNKKILNMKPNEYNLKEKSFKLPIINQKKRDKRKNNLKKKKSRRIKHFLDEEYKQNYDKTLSDGPLDSKKAVPSLSMSYKPSLSIYSKHGKPKVDKDLLIKINKMKDIPIPSYQESVWRRKMKEKNSQNNKYEALDELEDQQKQQLIVKGHKQKEKNERRRIITITTSSESDSDTSFDETEKSLTSESSNNKKNSMNENNSDCDNNNFNNTHIETNFNKKFSGYKKNEDQCVLINQKMKKESPKKIYIEKKTSFLKVPIDDSKHSILSEILSTETTLRSSKHIGADKKRCNCLIM